jgi:hypothetical protein
MAAVLNSPATAAHAVLDPELRRRALEMTSLRRRCRRCEALYVDGANTGTWHCRQHPATAEYDPQRRAWSCCNRRWVGEPLDRSGASQVNGCERADHCAESARSYDDYDDVLLAEPLLRSGALLERPLDEATLADGERSPVWKRAAVAGVRVAGAHACIRRHGK